MILTKNNLQNRNKLTRRFNASSRLIGRKVYKSFRISISKTDVSSGYKYQLNYIKIYTKKIVTDGRITRQNARS